MLNFFKKPIVEVDANVSMLEDLNENVDLSNSKRQRLESSSESLETNSHSQTEICNVRVDDNGNGKFSSKNASDNALIVNLNDIGRFTNCDKIPDDDILCDLITHPWTPDSKFQFPKISKRNLSFQIKWFQEFQWFVYSDVVKGALCKYCNFFC